MKTPIRIALFTIFLAMAALVGLQAQPATEPPKPFTAKVVKVTDGDTITVRFKGRQFRIRLERIDAPECGQPYAEKAKEVLAAKVSGKDVKIVWKRKDKNGRIVGQVFLGDRLMCREMVAEGYAWIYHDSRQDFRKDALLAKAEKDARDAKRGLWADPNPLPPRDFRNTKHEPYFVTDPKILVLVTPNGEKYHRACCQYVSKNKPAEITLEEALKRNCGPCSKCNPPLLKPKNN